MVLNEIQAGSDQIALSLHARALLKRRKDGYIPDTFLKLTAGSGPVPGESTDPIHKEEIEVDAFELELREDVVVENRYGAVSLSRTQGGRMAVPELYFIMRVNKATVALWNWMINGDPPMPKAILSCRKAGRGGKDFFIVTMEQVSVAEIKTIDTGEDDPTPINFVRLVFDRVKLEYQEMKPEGPSGGKHTATYDFNAHKAS